MSIIDVVHFELQTPNPKFDFFPCQGPARLMVEIPAAWLVLPGSWPMVHGSMTWPAHGLVALRTKPVTLDPGVQAFHTHGPWGH